MNYILALILFLSSGSLMAWNKTGHEVIAEIAFTQLRPAVKREIKKLETAGKAMDAKRISFAESAYWADSLRLRGITAYSTWHYMSLPYSTDGSRVAQPDQHNVVWATHKAAEVLRAEHASRFEKAMFLRFLLHFVGDAHQPLHCIDRFSREYPEGDRGGNRRLIKHPAANNLHQLWDIGAGALSNTSYKKLAKRIQKRYPLKKLAAEAKELDPYRWCQESYDLAKTLAYQTPANQSPSKAYLNAAQAASEKRLALAGYRLAEVLNRSIAVR